MTALTKYQRLEASGVWHSSPQAQGANVIVSIGDATLVITDMQERPLTHWSLAAVARANPGESPAIYHPDGDPGETLELADNETEMVEAIETLHAAIERQRPHPGRLRLMVLLGVLALVGLGAVLWLPGALRAHAVSVVPDVKRAEIGAALLQQIQRVGGAPCANPDGVTALGKLAARLPGAEGPGRLVVMRDGVETTAHIPGGILLLAQNLVEGFDEPDVIAGYIVAERLRAEAQDPLADLLRDSPVWASFRLLTTGQLTDETLTAYAERLLTAPQYMVEHETLLVGFTAYEVASTPYAYAVDNTGESTLSLIEADPFVAERPPPLLSDADWLRLQSICGG